MRVRRPTLLLAAALALSPAVLPGVAAAAPAPAVGSAVGVAGVRADDGAYVVSETAVAPGVIDLAISSPALHGTGNVRLFLPAHWTSEPTRRWPSLWLLHGANDTTDYRSWDTKTPMRSFMAGRDVLTVMPTGGGSGFYTDEWNFGFPGGAGYETFHTVELAQILGRGYRASDRRVVAGISMGGFGAISYTARHPGFFRAAASYSGFLDTLAPAGPLCVSLIRVTNGSDVASLWGDSTLSRSRWQEHNPADLAGRLKGVPLYVSYGDGLGGTVDGALEALGIPGSLPIDPIEVLARDSAERFLDRAASAGVTVTSHYVPQGAHYWTFWDPEFRRSWPILAAGLGVGAS